MATSFQKKTRAKVIQIAGAKPSLYNNQLLVSTGIPSLDALLGGGLAVGTVLLVVISLGGISMFFKIYGDWAKVSDEVLIKEDTFGSYGRLLLKYFCAEAVMTGHALLLSSLDYDTQQLLKELPAPIVDDPGPDTGQEIPEESDHMKIAWRYRHLPKFQSSPSAVKFGHYYDLSKSMEHELISTVDVTTLQDSELGDELEENKTINRRYGEVLRQIQNKIDTGGYSTSSQTEKRNILRIAIHSLGSPLWGENGGIAADDHYDPSLPRFLLALRAILRSAFAACIITMPTHLFCDRVYVRRLERLCDTVVHLDSFVGSDKEKNPAYKEYHGLFNIKQLPRLNSLVCHMPDSLDLAFKLRRKKFTIEKLHLPPELSETASRSQEDPVPNMKPVSGCGTGSGKNKLEF